MVFFGMGHNGRYDPRISHRGLLVLNHEAITPAFLHPAGQTVSGGVRTAADEVIREFYAHGVSVLELVRETPEVFWTRRNGGHWVFRGQNAVFDAARDPESFSNESIPHAELLAILAARPPGSPRVPLPYPLMLDPFHYYSRLEALELAKGLEKLNYLWMEEPMDEHSMSSYVWLCEQTSLPICGPETAEGKMYVRAEWIKAGACDMVRSGVGDVGGITGLVKCVHLAEAFGMHLEVHGGGVGNLHVLGSMFSPGLYYERGLLHPFLDWDQPPAWLNKAVDPMDDEGFVHISPDPGLGYDINWDYINANKLD